MTDDGGPTTEDRPRIFKNKVK